MGLIFFGPPGAGKGTQANIIIKEFGFVHLSTGDLIREEIKNNTDLGLYIRETSGKGELVPDNIISKMMFANLSKLKDNRFILDGYPRTVSQAESLIDFCKQNNSINISDVISFVMPLEALQERILGRMICAKCNAVYHAKFNPPIINGICDQCGEKSLKLREDDNINTLQIRINEYNIKTLPVLKFLSNYFQIFEINASLDVEEITNKLREKIVRY